MARLTRKVALQGFVQFLMEEDPIPATCIMDLQMLDASSLSFGAFKVPAYVDMKWRKRGHGTASVVLAAKGKTIERLLELAGHEYKHILQTFKEFRFPKTEIDMDYEIDAQVYGTRMAARYLQALA